MQDQWVVIAAGSDTIESEWLSEHAAFNQAYDRSKETLKDYYVLRRVCRVTANVNVTADYASDHPKSKKPEAA